MRNLLESLIFASLILFLLTISFFIAQMRMESFELGYQIAELQKQKSQLQEDARNLKAEISELQSYSHLSEQNQQLGLNLLPPHKWLPHQTK